MIKTLNTDSLELFSVPFKELNCGQRMDLYRLNDLSEDTIDKLESRNED